MMAGIYSMNNDDAKIRAELQKAQRHADRPAPNFDSLFEAAERQVRDSRRMRFAGLTAAAAMAVLAIGLLPNGEDGYSYVHIDELTATTQWAAPSDFLFPEHQIDIYRDLPRLIESTVLSTDTEEGTLQ